MEFIFEQGRDIYENHPGILFTQNILNEVNLLQIRDSLCTDPTRLGSIPHSLILKAELIKQSFGLTNYEDINILNRDPLFADYLGCTISPETLRQKLDFLGRQEGILDKIDDINFSILQKCNFATEIYNGERYIPLDLDVTPFSNPGVHKEGISMTYKKVDGFAPMMTYLGGFAVAFQLREGSVHSEKNTPEFLDKCLNRTKSIGVDLNSVLIRADSAHDDAEFINTCTSHGAKFIVKVNPRGENYGDIINFVKRTREPEILKNGNKKYFYVAIRPNRKGVSNENIYQVFEIEEETLKDEQSLLQYCEVGPDDPSFGREGWKKYEVQSYWTNLNIDEILSPDYNEKRVAKVCIKAYHNHATSEQYHSEVKTDMRLELLPSKYFTTNSLILRIAAISYNILRIVSFIAPKLDKSFQYHSNHRTKRVRLSTVINNFFNVPCRIIRHARKTIVKFSRSYKHYNSFLKILSTI